MPRIDSVVVLAGGRSTRFGSEKLKAVIDGESLLSRAVSRLSALQVPIAVVLAPDSEVPNLPVEVTIARDQVAYGGPLGGVVAGLHAVHGEMSLIAAGDMPDPRMEVIRLMEEAASSERAVILGDDHDFQTLPMVVPRPAALSLAAGMPAGASLRSFLESLGVEPIEPQAWRLLDVRAETLRDVDEPGDLPL